MSTVFLTHLCMSCLCEGAWGYKETLRVRILERGNSNIVGVLLVSRMQRGD